MGLLPSPPPGYNDLTHSDPWDHLAIHPWGRTPRLVPSSGKPRGWGGRADGAVQPPASFWSGKEGDEARGQGTTTRHLQSQTCGGLQVFVPWCSPCPAGLRLLDLDLPAQPSKCSANGCVPEGMLDPTQKHKRKRRPRFSFLFLYLFSFLLKVCLFILREKEKEHKRGRNRERERERERTPSRFLARSTEPDTGLELTNCEIVT